MSAKPPNRDARRENRLSTSPIRGAQQSDRQTQYFDRGRILEILHRLVAGVALRLDGYWRSRTLNGQSSSNALRNISRVSDEPRIR
jgi:hypothetical protein